MNPLIVAQFRVGAFLNAITWKVKVVRDAAWVLLEFHAQPMANRAVTVAQRPFIVCVDRHIRSDYRDDQ